tara:strand:+ start:118 stop:390 length:273 start_codon:yes stop_codon:yes gene_type:complete
MGMPLNARMTRYTITTSPLEISLSSGNGKTILQGGVANAYLAYNLSDFDIDRFFTLTAGSTLVLDQPVPSQNELIYVKADSTTILEVWIS